MSHSMKRILSTAASALLMITVLASCSSNAPKNSASPGAGTKETLYLFNNKGENAEQFKQMCADFTAETGIPTSPFSVGSGQDATEPLRTQMNSKNPPAFFSMQGLKELPEWVESGRALDLTTVQDAEFKKIVDAIPADMRLSTDGKASYGIPYNVEGYGYMVDRQMIADLFGPEQADAVIKDLCACSYNDFTAFCTTLDAYISAPSAATVDINGNSYTLQAAKTGRAAKLTGVFAFAGSEAWTFGDHLINVAMNAVFKTPAEAQNADAAQLDKLKQPFIAYAKGLDFVTQHVGGLKGHASRGAELINASNFGYDQSVQMFADGNDIFLQQGNWASVNIQKVDAEVAARSTFIPVKLPLTDDMITTGKTALEINQSIPVYVPGYYAINAKASEEAQKAAIQFLTWMQKPENVQKYIVTSFQSIPYNADANTQLPDSYGKSIQQYMVEGKTLAAPYHGTPNLWSNEVVGKKVMESYLTKTTWTEQDYADIADYAIAQWKERLNS